MNFYKQAENNLKIKPKTWLVTGVAGFIGSHLLESLLALDQKVVGLDNFFSGYEKNLNHVKDNVGNSAWKNFRFINGSICSIEDCKNAVESVDFVLHEAAVGSVPRSIENPILSNEVNVLGFLNLLVASRDAGVKRFVYAASSSTYGDEPTLPKIESRIGKPLSPYAVTKYVNELYADVFGMVYGLETIGLRYFNVFGPRQDPNGSYAAVIPKWINAILSGDDLYINGDGTTSRDFCYIENVIQANILGALTDNHNAINQVFNIAVGEKTSLNELYALIVIKMQKRLNSELDSKITYQDFRSGDIKHSLADISKAINLLEYVPEYNLADGLEKTVDWFINSGRASG